MGESQGLRGDIVDFDIGLQDYWVFIDAESDFRSHHHNIPKFLVSHSVGSLYALNLCIKRPDFFRGCISINPLLEFKNKPGMIAEASLKAQAMLQIKERQTYSKMDNFLPEEIRRLREDKLDFFIETKMSIESYLQIREMQLEV